MADSDDQQPLAEEGLDAKAVHERVAFSGVEKRGHVGLGSSKKPTDSTATAQMRWQSKS